MQIARYQAPLTIQGQTPPQPLARPIRRRSFQNEVLLEKYDKYLTVIQVSPHTRRAYGVWAKRFGAWLDGRNFATATKTEVRAWLATVYERKLKRATQAQAVYAVRSFYRFLELGDQVLFSPPRQVLTPKVEIRLPHALSVEEIEEFIEATRTPRDRALIELAFASGLRVSELSHLRVEDLDLRAGSLVVRHGKGGNDRIGLFGRPAAALRTYLGERTTGFVFQPEPRIQKGGITRGKYGDWWGQWREGGKMHSVRLGDFDLPTKAHAREAFDKILRAANDEAVFGKLPPAKEPQGERPLSARSILRIVGKIAKRANIGKRVTVHTFRHSFATACLNSGMDLLHVQKLLGHANVNVTARYLHIATAKLQDTHAKFHPRG